MTRDLEPSNRQPYWLWKAKRLFPNRFLAACVSVASLAVCILFVGVAVNVEGCWPMAIPGLLFFMGSLATASASVTREFPESTKSPSSDQEYKPTFAVLVLLTGVCSWILTIAMHIFGAIFKNGPGSTKYFVTLGIAIASTAFMQVYGKRVVRDHFGSMGGRNLEINGRQAVYIIFYMVGCGFYIAWLMHA